MDGECFIRKVRGFPNRFGYALQMIDPDQVDHLYSRARTDSPSRKPSRLGSEGGENEIRLGVEVDRWGRPVAYWINPGHPSDFGGSLLRERIPADQVIHLFDPYRVNQTRGLTWFHPVMMAMKMFHGYTETELVAARTGCGQDGFLRIHRRLGLRGSEPGFADAHGGQPGNVRAPASRPDLQRVQTGASGTRLENFCKTNLRLIASGLGASYNSLANDLVGVNYSSLRSGLLIERDRWSVLQQWFAEDFMQPIFDDWLPLALLSGGLQLARRLPDSYTEGVWLPRGWRWVDPLKDSQGAIIDIAAALNSPERVVAERGDDLEEIYEEIAEAQKLAKNYGIEMNLNPPARPSTEKNPAEVEDDETEEGQQQPKTGRTEIAQ